jgi:hypothetical protein
MADKDDVQKSLADLIRMAAELPEGAGRELVRTAITDTQNSVEVVLDDEGRMRTDSAVISGKAFKRMAAETTNGTSWCC